MTQAVCNSSSQTKCPWAVTIRIRSETPRATTNAVTVSPSNRRWRSFMETFAKRHITRRAKGSILIADASTCSVPDYRIGFHSDDSQPLFLFNCFLDLMVGKIEQPLSSFAVWVNFKYFQNLGFKLDKIALRFSKMASCQSRSTRVALLRVGIFFPSFHPFPRRHRFDWPAKVKSRRPGLNGDLKQVVDRVVVKREHSLTCYPRRCVYESVRGSPM